MVRDLRTLLVFCTLSAMCVLMHAQNTEKPRKCKLDAKVRRCNKVAYGKTLTYVIRTVTGLNREALQESIKTNCTGQICCLYYKLKCILAEIRKPENRHCLTPENETSIDKTWAKLKKLRGCKHSDLGRLLHILGEGAKLFQLKRKRRGSQPVQRPDF
ncbi:hypothetical protein CRM22_000505 [Opisthorchis felineus]|uniref:Saposin B-type domain-containing protein n=1 Tax=Opisthorchis felineus TaxID=147828 RepID=A0A4S2MF09_OPIFE|nr:hypothetical protein CRM22_000505 [Opisthorchis felineus]